MQRRDTSLMCAFSHSKSLLSVTVGFSIKAGMFRLTVYFIWSMWQWFGLAITKKSGWNLSNSIRDTVVVWQNPGMLRREGLWTANNLHPILLKCLTWFAAAVPLPNTTYFLRRNISYIRWPISRLIKS